MAFGGTLPAMSKDSREKATPKTEDATAKHPNLPPEIAQLIEIEGRSVRIDPRRYLSKTFRAALPLIQYRLEESSPNTFTLEPKLFEDFVSSLRLVLEKKFDPPFKPSDCISFVLLSLASGRDVNQSQFDGGIDPEGYWEKLALPPNLIAPGGQPTSSDSKARNSNKVSLNVAFGSNFFPDEAFALQITMEGEPLRPFYDLEAGLKMTPAEKRALERRAKAIWKLLSDKISSRLGIARIEPGRSLTNQGQLAAFLRGHQGYTWPRVARELCKNEGCKDEKGHWSHSHSCQERYRKLAALYWKREAARYADLAQSRQTPTSPVTS